MMFAWLEGRGIDDPGTKYIKGSAVVLRKRCNRICRKGAARCLMALG